MFKETAPCCPLMVPYELSFVPWSPQAQYCTSAYLSHKHYFALKIPSSHITKTLVKKFKRDSIAKVSWCLQEEHEARTKLSSGRQFLAPSTVKILKPLPPNWGHTYHTILCAHYGPNLNSCDSFFLLVPKYDITIIKDKLSQLWKARKSQHFSSF